MKYKVGIAGFGVVGKRRKHFIQRHPDLEVVGVCDRMFECEGALEDGVKFYSDYRRLLDQDLDLLFVCLTNDVAAEVVCLSLEKGNHTFCEKPPGRNLKDILDVIEVEKKHPALKLKYGFNHRYHDSVIEAKKILSDGSLGAILSIKGVYGKSKIVSFESDWRTKRDIAGGGILLDQGIHLLDLILYLAGDFEVVSSVVKNSYWEHDVEDNAYAILRSKTGAVAMIHSSATQWQHKFELDIGLEKGAIILSGILSGSKSYGDEKITIIKTKEGDCGNPSERSEKFVVDSSWEREIHNFVACIKEARKVEIGSSEDALKSMKLVNQIYTADQSWAKKYGVVNHLQPKENESIKRTGYNVYNSQQSEVNR